LIYKLFRVHEAFSALRVLFVLLYLALLVVFGILRLRVLLVSVCFWIPAELRVFGLLFANLFSSNSCNCYS